MDVSICDVGSNFFYLILRIKTPVMSMSLYNIYIIYEQHSNWNCCRTPCRPPLTDQRHWDARENMLSSLHLLTGFLASFTVNTTSTRRTQAQTPRFYTLVESRGVRAFKRTSTCANCNIPNLRTKYLDFVLFGKKFRVNMQLKNWRWVTLYLIKIITCCLYNQ